MLGVPKFYKETFFSLQRRGKTKNGKKEEKQEEERKGAFLLYSLTAHEKNRCNLMLRHDIELEHENIL